MRRMLALLGVALAVAAVCTWLGLWQLDRAIPQARVSDAPPIPLAEVLAPQSPLSGDLVGRSVSVAGTFGADQLVTPEGIVVTPLRVGDAYLAVARGRGDPVPPPEGTVELTGWLQPGGRGGEAAAAGQVSALSTAELANRWGTPIFSAYLVIESPAQPGLTLLSAPTVQEPLRLQNLAYAVQWWIFGAFALALWLRVFRDWKSEVSG